MLTLAWLAGWLCVCAVSSPVHWSDVPWDVACLLTEWLPTLDLFSLALCDSLSQSMIAARFTQSTNVSIIVTRDKSLIQRGMLNQQQTPKLLILPDLTVFIHGGTSLYTLFSDGFPNGLLRDHHPIVRQPKWVSEMGDCLSCVFCELRNRVELRKEMVLKLTEMDVSSYVSHSGCLYSNTLQITVETTHQSHQWSFALPNQDEREHSGVPFQCEHRSFSFAGELDGNPERILSEDGRFKAEWQYCSKWQSVITAEMAVLLESGDDRWVGIVDMHCHLLRKWVRIDGVIPRKKEIWNILVIEDRMLICWDNGYCVCSLIGECRLIGHGSYHSNARITQERSLCRLIGINGEDRSCLGCGIRDPRMAEKGDLSGLIGEQQCSVHFSTDLWMSWDHSTKELTVHSAHFNPG